MSVLSTGTGALIAFQRALATVSHNVANVNTEGYSRQRAEFATRSPTDYGYGFVGNGVKIGDIQRIADQPGRKGEAETDAFGQLDRPVDQHQPDPVRLERQQHLRLLPDMIVR